MTRRLLLRGLSRFLSAGWMVVLSSGAAFAGPAGENVSGGTAIVTRPDANTTIVTQSTDRAVINWGGFDVGAKESVLFSQPDSSAVVLNRVTGTGAPSQINGRITGNGSIYITNSNGVLVGPTGSIDANSVLLTTQDIGNDAFMAGSSEFSSTGGAGSIVNKGKISAKEGGFVALVAPGVRNEGSIAADKGKVSLSSGNGFTLDLNGDDLIKFGVSDPVAEQVIDAETGKPLSSLVDNSGRIVANGGSITLQSAGANTVLDNVINTSGVLEADTIGESRGKIVVEASTRAVTGTPQKVKIAGTASAKGKATGTAGGTIVVTGQDVSVEGATVDASGKTAGGTILIGGDYDGGHPEITVDHPLAHSEQFALPTARSVDLDSNTLLDASAESGDGGKIVVRGDLINRTFASLKAPSGSPGGLGGFIEVSGKTVLSTFDADAGQGGDVLLDPEHLTVTASPPPCVYSAPDYCGGDSYITVDQALAHYASVGRIVAEDIRIADAINSTGGIEFNAYNGDLVVDAAIDVNYLSLDASGNLTINAPIDAPGYFLSLGGDHITVNAPVSGDNVTFDLTADSGTASQVLQLNAPLSGNTISGRVAGGWLPFDNLEARDALRIASVDDLHVVEALPQSTLAGAYVVLPANRQQPFGSVSSLSFAAADALTMDRNISDLQKVTLAGTAIDVRKDITATSSIGITTTHTAQGDEPVSLGATLTAPTIAVDVAKGRFVVDSALQFDDLDLSSPNDLVVLSHDPLLGALPSLASRHYANDTAEFAFEPPYSLPK